MTSIHHIGETRRGRRAPAAGSVGNLIEWYEFGVYGYFATIIAARHFSADWVTGSAVVRCWSW